LYQQNCGNRTPRLRVGVKPGAQLFVKRFRFDGKGQTKAAARLLPEKGAVASTELAMSQ